MNYFIMCHRKFFATFFRIHADSNRYFVRSCGSKWPLRVFRVPFSRSLQIESKLPSQLLASSSSAIYERERNEKFMNVYELDIFIVCT